jgi:hypothetical protein
LELRFVIAIERVGDDLVRNQIEVHIAGNRSRHPAFFGRLQRIRKLAKLPASIKHHSLALNRPIRGTLLSACNHPCDTKQQQKHEPPGHSEIPRDWMHRNNLSSIRSPEYHSMPSKSRRRAQANRLNHDICSVVLEST